MTTPLHFYSPSSVPGHSPRILSLSLEVNRTPEPALRKIETACDKIHLLEQTMTTLQRQQQLDGAEASFKPSDLTEIKRCRAALEQGVLNLQIHFQEFINSY